MYSIFADFYDELMYDVDYKKRAAYHNYYADTRWGARGTYNLCLNSALGIDIIVDIIVSAAKEMMK